MKPNRRESDPRIDNIEKKIDVIHTAIMGDIGDQKKKGMLQRLSEVELKVRLILYVLGVCFSGLLIKYCYVSFI